MNQILRKLNHQIHIVRGVQQVSLYPYPIPELSIRLLVRFGNKRMPLADLHAEYGAKPANPPSW